MFKRTKVSIATTTFLCLIVSVTANAQKKVKDEVVKKIEAALPAAAPAKPAAERKVLLFSKTNGFRHGSIPVAVKALTLLGEKTGAYQAVHSEDDAMFEPEKLKEFDLVIMVNTTGQIFRPRRMPTDEAGKQQALDREKRLQQSLVEFVKSGKGLAGVHSATDTYKKWKDYNDMMGGAFIGHPWHMDVPVRLLDTKHPLNKIFAGEGFTIKDEIYQFRPDTALATDRRMLLALEPTWAGVDRGKREDKFYPISWVSSYGKGRTYYCSLGHRNEIYYNPKILEHYLAGIQYALGDLKAEDDPIKIETSSKSVDK
jgi:type 1 glutamine amidotransferase